MSPRRPSGSRRPARSGRRVARPRRVTRPRRPGERRRRALLLVGILALVSGMIVSIRRGAEGRRVSEMLEELEREERIARARLSGVAATLDSLRSRERILQAALPLGLRPATDGDVVFLAEPPPRGPSTALEGGQGS